MTNGNRGITRTPGRTPPFILVGLLVILAFLGYSYWSLSSTNSRLAAELDTVNVEKKDTEQKNFESEKILENTREELRLVQGNLDKARRDFQDKDIEYNNVKTDLTSKQADVDKLKNQLGDCESSYSENKSALDSLKNEKAELERQLNEAKQKQTVCDLVGCTNPVRDILTIVAKAVGSDAVGKALLDANLDPAKLLEGINFPAPVAQQLNQQQQGQQQEGQNQPQQGQIQLPQGQIQQPQGQIQQPQGQIQQPQGQIQQPQGQIQVPQGQIQVPLGQNQVPQGQNEQQGVIIPNQQINESQVKKDTDVANNESIANDNADNVINETHEAKDLNLVFQSEKDKNTQEITNYLANKALEKKIAEIDAEKKELDNIRKDEANAEEKDENTNNDEAERNVVEKSNI